MNEQDNPLMEANCIVAEDEYFAARPQIDNRDRRVVFQAGFKRAWESAYKVSGKAPCPSAPPRPPYGSEVG